MIQIKLNGADCAMVRAASETLQKSRVEKSKLEKDEAAAKETITRELEEKRGVILDQLPAGEFVIVQCDGKDVVKVDIQGVQRFDQKGFALVHPDLLQKFTRPCPTKYFKSLLE